MMATASVLAVLGLLLCTNAWGQLEAPAAPFETRPWPADGVTLLASPPAFIWTPKEPAEEYVVEYSRNPSFPPDDTGQAGTRWLIHVPRQSLRPDAWHWRWRPADEPNAWSPVRSFVIPEGAIELPFPDVSAVLQGLGTTRPRVIVPADRLAEARQWAAETQGDMLERTQRDAERALEDELLPEPDFVPPPGDPERGPKYVKVFRTTRPVYGRMSRLAEGYLLSGDETMGQAAKRLLMNFVSWDPEGSTSLSHNDEPATEFVRVCPRVYDWIHPVLSEEERERCRDVFRVRMAQLYGRWANRPFERFPYESHNMGYYLPDLTEACIAMAGELDVEEMLTYCLLQLWSPYYPPYGGDDGGWQEGPPYWGWVADVFARLYYLVEQATGVGIAQRSSLRNQVYFKLYANPPYAKMSPFGDGQTGAAGGAQAMYRLAALYRDPYALWYAREKNASASGLEGWMWDVSGIEPKEPIDLPQSRRFSSVGEACLHTALWSERENVQFLFRSCPFGGISHAYADQNTYALDAYGEPLIIASGHYPYYGSPHHVQWTRTTKASNSILVNGQGQPATWNWDAKGEISRFASSPGADYLVGDAKPAYPGLLEEYLRKVLFVRPLQTGGPTLIAIHDELEAEEPSSFQWLLHALEEMEVDEESQRVIIERGAARCRVDFLMPQGLTFSQTDQYTVPPENEGYNQWHLTASLEKKAAKRRSLIVLVPHRAEEADAAPEVRRVEGEGCAAAIVDGGDAEHLLLFRTQEGTASFAEWGLSTDAEAVAVTRRGGEVTGFFAAGASELTVNGNVMLSAEQPVDASVTDFGAEALVSVRGDRPVACLLACRRKPVAAQPIEGAEPELEYDDVADLLKVTSSRRELVAQLVFDATRALAAGAPPSLRIGDGEPTPTTGQVFPLVRRVRYGANYDARGGHHEFVVRARRRGERAGALTLSSGSHERRFTVDAADWRELASDALDLPARGRVALTLDRSLGGECEIESIVARRAYERNLVANAGFEDGPLGGPPALWRAGTITNDARCTLEAVAEGRTGERSVKITCAKAGGDFGAHCDWPGVSPADYDRTFRVGVWVKNGADSQVGIQVTNRDWKFHQTTSRIRDNADWTETFSVFTLPAGENLTHLRLHMRADREDAVIYADEVTLVEVRPE